MGLRSITLSFARLRSCVVRPLFFRVLRHTHWLNRRARLPAAKPPYNIIFVISDQEAEHLLVTSNDYELPARAELQRRGITFRNHYTASAMCTPSRAAFFSGAAAAGQWRLRSDGACLSAEPEPRPAEYGLGAQGPRLHHRLLRQVRVEQGSARGQSVRRLPLSARTLRHRFFQFRRRQIRHPGSGLSRRSLFWRRGRALAADQRTYPEPQRPAVLSGGELSQSARHHVRQCQSSRATGYPEGDEG